MGEFSAQVISLFSRDASEQGGVISGDNPAHYNPSNPIRLWIIQVVIIIAMTQLLSLFLSRIRQPRVIAEIIGGVILGPTIMGRIPGFKSSVFPDEAMPLLNVTATVGLILFLFLVGLEIDTRLLRRNVLASASVSFAGLVFPLGLGAALGVGIYREFINPSVNFGYFLLFTAVAVGITAFPVLCRILTELKLLDTEVGLVVLSAGIGNDVLGWVLLALTVALVNASSGLTALWVLLASAGYVIFLLFPVKWAFHWLIRRSGSLEQGSPTPFVMTVTILLVLISAFFTDIIGVHAIFGGFLAGLLIPHENGFAISIVEKIEDLVSILFLPIYFTLSGLRTNLGLLNEGRDWGYIILICVVAFTSKFIACGGAALATGFKWREAGAIGSLMSCKGLVELIVLNIGLQAGILDTRTFSMFVVHAIVLTFVTTPLTLLFYPARYRIHHKPSAHTPQGEETSLPQLPHHKDDDRKTKFALILDKVEALPAAMTLSQLLHAPSVSSSVTLGSRLEVVDEKGDPPSVVEDTSSNNITIDALRLMELTSRTSAVLRSTEADALIYNDPVVTVYRTFGQLNSFNVTAKLSVVNYHDFPEAVAQHVEETQSELVLIPWPRGIVSVLNDESQSPQTGAQNPFDGIFHRTTSQDQTSSIYHSEYIRHVFGRSSCDVALFVDRGITTMPSGKKRQHLFLAFFGGPDDRLALNFLVQLCENELVVATVVRITKSESDEEIVEGKEAPKSPGATSLHPTIHQTVGAADTVYGQHTTQTRLASDTADNLLWSKYTSTSERHTPGVSAALSRITFNSETFSKPLHEIVSLAKQEAAVSVAQSGRTLIVLAGRSRRLAVESLQAELRSLTTEVSSAISSSVPKTLGDLGAAMVATNVNASLLIFQAAKTTL